MYDYVCTRYVYIYILYACIVYVFSLSAFYGALKVKTLRGGGGKRSHDATQPWGGLGYDVMSNTYASAPASTATADSNASTDTADTAESSSSLAGPAAVGQASAGTPRRGGGQAISPGGRPRTEGFLERLLGHRSAGTPKH